MKSKQFFKGLEQLMNEGVAQLFVNQFNGRRIVGTVGQLQFEVIQYRLEHEYNAKCRWEPVHLYKACWIEAETDEALENFKERKYQYHGQRHRKPGRVPRRLRLYAEHGATRLQGYQVPLHQ
jgi:peptide chain release factor 3